MACILPKRWKVIIEAEKPKGSHRKKREGDVGKGGKDFQKDSRLTFLHLVTCLTRSSRTSPHESH